jgi:PAS domain S-box-containing protein
MRLFVAVALVLASLTLSLIGMTRIVRAQGGDPMQSVPPVVLTDEQEEYPLPSNLEILRDPTRQLTVQDVSSPEYSDRFVPNSKKIPNLGMTQDAVWVRLRVRNDSASNTWRLAMNDARVSQIALYVPSPEPPYFVEKIAGRDFPFAARDVPHHNFIFRLNLPSGTEQTLYLCLKSAKTALVFPLTILTADALAQRDQKELLFLGLFYGAMLIMAGYNLFLYFSLRETNYLYLALFIIFYSLSSAGRDGLAHQYLWPSIPDPVFVQFLIMLTLVFQIKFTTGILDTRRFVPDLHLVLNGLVYACLVAGIVSLIISAGLLINPLIAITLGIEGLAAFKVWRQGYRAARFYLASWALLLVAGFAFVLSSLNLFFGLTIPESLVQVAMAIGALFWSLALADRVQLLKGETEAANRRLERSERRYRSIFENSRDAIFISSQGGKLVDLNPAGVELFGFDPTELKEIDVGQVYVEKAERERTIQDIQARGYLQDYPVRMRRKDGTEIDALITSNLWQDEELQVAGFQGIVRDVTERRRIEAELEQHRHHLEELVQVRTAQAAAELAERQLAQEALQRRIEELSALNEIANTISTETDIQTTLEHVAGRVSELFDAQATLITRLDRQHSQVRLLAVSASLPLPGLRSEAAFDLNGVPIFRQVADQNKSLVLIGAQASPLIAGMHGLLQTLGTHSLLLVPLRILNDVIGVMTIHNSQVEYEFSGDEIHLAETIASEIATAIENVRLSQQAQMLAVEQERHRLARDMHDSVIQTLYSTVLLASGWRMMAEQGRLDSSSTAVHFQQVADQSEQALKEMRLLLFQLRPPDLEKVGLVGAIQQRLDAVERRVSIETSLLTTGESRPLAPRIENELYNITQEALNNALRHAQASSIIVRLDFYEQCVELAVADNGRGFELDTGSGGMGLHNMQERAEEIGAVFSVTSAPHQGTKIHIRLELTPDGNG